MSPEELDAEIASIHSKLDRLLVLFTTKPKYRNGLTANEQYILGELQKARGKPLSPYTLADGLPSNRHSNRTPDAWANVVRAHVCNLRTKGFLINNKRSVGYWLEP